MRASCYYTNFSAHVLDQAIHILAYTQHILMLLAHCFRHNPLSLHLASESFSQHSQKPELLAIN